MVQIKYNEIIIDGAVLRKTIKYTDANKKYI